MHMPKPVEPADQSACLSCQPIDQATERMAILCSPSHPFTSYISIPCSSFWQPDVTTQTRANFLFLFSLPDPNSSGASVATFDVSPKKDDPNPHSHADLTTLSPVQAETYHLAQPGVNALRQDQPHPHHAIIDPSGKYLLVPDLGADLVRIYLLNDDGRLRFTALAPLVMPAGSGPRHGAFLVTPAGDTYLYMTSEIANTITGFKVTYTSSSTIEFTEVYYSGSHGLGVEFDKGRLAPEEDVFPTLAGEIHVSVCIVVIFYLSFAFSVFISFVEKGGSQSQRTHY